MTEEQENQMRFKWRITHPLMDMKDWECAYRSGFKAGQETTNEKPVSICRGCGNYNDGMCDIYEDDPGIRSICGHFLAVAFDEKEQAK